MEIKITPSAIEALKEKLLTAGKKNAVRVYVAGLG